MNAQTKIVEYLRSKYEPIAIMLHGSRALGKERKHSDWDIIMLFEGKIPRKGFREEINGEDVEWKTFQVPIADAHILDTFDTYLQSAQILWEKESIGSKILEKAAVIYAKGPNLSSEDIKREKVFFEHKILGMKDDADTSYMFFRHLSVLFNRAANMWFVILHNEFSKPFYNALPEIKEKDSEYYNRLMILCSNTSSNKEKIDAAEWISKRLFA